jgi:hypothetical protein
MITAGAFETEFACMLQSVNARMRRATNDEIQQWDGNHGKEGRYSKFETLQNEQNNCLHHLHENITN